MLSPASSHSNKLILVPAHRRQASGNVGARHSEAHRSARQRQACVLLSPARPVLETSVYCMLSSAMRRSSTVTRKPFRERQHQGKESRQVAVTACVENR